ncbi:MULTISPECIES: HD domain-containing protein [Maribacter]|uniref:HD domain-containing protein n=1 Tax=Maribacter dokdonensis TaxID=320912 RepID=A0ABY0UW36_9FLAO|nr:MULTISPECIES: HD domain-containing protein [Maribacter]HAF78336.1 HD domain-containing protein [Maribacter sp.]APA64474.1 phosphohydrolase [Maribacter sp. 1_2014MBL_MicDiv]KSA12650.1 Metal-dependent phosphohydrolase [Maribacter dokdonensis DSW-8]MBU2900409.1 HD domain-containing protein [Maribacter dokdonensis]PHN94803.1 HD domain-containing protein [Maribacter sp. 6B07]|tara:strand:+ start:3459 stop:4136 length:678 start_codon:yes stop_codon:yes gene_type:complete
MTNSEIVEETIIFVKETLKNAEGGHDWFHIERVFNNTMLIAKEEDVNLLVVSLGALLHDIADAKFNDGDESLGPKMAENFLLSLKVPKRTINHVTNIIKYSSFKAGLNDGKMKKKLFTSKELQVVQDADRLDAIGAIGIARAFNYGGFKNRALYDPSIPPNLEMSKEEYKKSKAPTLNHFYEKLLLLKDKMNTATGKRLAQQRHQYMIDFLEQFYQEWSPLKNLS